MATAAQHRGFAPRVSRASPARRRVHRVVTARAAAPAAPTGAWNLDGCPDGIILSLARRLEAEWTRLPNVRDAPCAPELKSVDATAPDGDPATRIRIENLCLQTDAFRKMHLEVAWGLGGLEVLHCVIYPWRRWPRRYSRRTWWHSAEGSRCASRTRRRAPTTSRCRGNTSTPRAR